jgi:hypothetical protein
MDGTGDHHVKKIRQDHKDKGHLFSLICEDQSKDKVTCKYKYDHVELFRTCFQ